MIDGAPLVANASVSVKTLFQDVVSLDSACTIDEE